MEKIPDKIKSFNFVLLKDKIPLEKGWQNKVHRINDSIFQEHLSRELNYGVQPNNSSVVIEDKSYFLIVLDFDKKEFQDKVLPLLPETFTTTSGSSKQCYHLWYASDNNKAFKIHDEVMDTLCDIIGSGNQVVAPGSKHNSGSIYSVVNDKPIQFIPYSELEALLKPYDKSPKKEKKIISPRVNKDFDDSIASKSVNSVSMKQVLQEIGINNSMNPTGCFDHSSVGGKCFSWNEEVAHCFHCNSSWNKFSLIRDAKNLRDKETFEWFANKAGLSNELTKARKEYVSKQQEQLGINKEAFGAFNINNQTKNFVTIQPIYYDKAGLWWLWNSKDFKWEMVDEVDILNMINLSTGQDIIEPRNRTIILNSLKQKGRLNIPLPMKDSWIQFKNKIYDIKTGESFESSSKYFTVNRIPHEINHNIETPVMDRIFTEWVGEKYLKTLYEILAYCLLPSYPIHRMFCLIGTGSNGKSCFLQILERFVGSENLCATELDTLLNSRFEIGKLHKKLVCIMGETNFSEINRTSIIKKLTGGDKIGFEFKNKTPFEANNYAKIVIATNNLPSTTDKTEGFYRRWLIIDFNNKFEEKKDILNDIPLEEYKSLASKSLLLLNELLNKREFTNEGSVEERMKRYEDKSNPFDKFWKDNILEDPNDKISLKQFKERLDAWCQDNRFRKMSDSTINSYMKEKGIEKYKRTMEWVETPFNQEKPRYWVWEGVKWI